MSVSRSVVTPPQYLSPPVDLYDPPPTEAEFTTQGGMGTGLAQENLESMIIHPAPSHAPENKRSSGDGARDAIETALVVSNPYNNPLSPVNYIPDGGSRSRGDDGVQPCCTELTGCLESCRTGVSTGAGQLYHEVEAGITVARDALTSIDCTPCVNGLTQCTDGVGQLMGGVVHLCTPVGQCIAGCFGAVGWALEGCGKCCCGLLECVGKMQ